ncbi:Abnormal spindle-like microcephaly-associated protein-like protein [Drosera capensis]
MSLYWIVYQNVDEGRLIMKPHCPISADVGMKQKAIKVLLCYNPIWLQIGLYIILGGESLLPNEDSSSEQDIAFLRMVLEKQVFSHCDLAKAHAYNKLVAGLYRPGYYESLGNVILKKFLLLVLILDKAKSNSALPIKYGIDGIDGGSPPLFTLQSKIKSSQQMLTDFLSSDVMHGEGNLITHLTLLGYKVNYQQIPLIEYDFLVTDLFQDMQDGVCLSRAIQLLQNNPSILGKIVLPTDALKKKLQNCRVALQYLKQAGVPLADEDGIVILEEDIASGDKELTVSLLWNIFVHLQMPLLVTKAIIYDEIIRIRKAPTVRFQGSVNFDTCSHLDILLDWIKAICENYDLMLENFTSMVDGTALWCLLDYYFHKELHRPRAQKVLQISDILENNGASNERSVIILLVFLSSLLLQKDSKDQLNFHKLMGCSCQTRERRRSSTGRSSGNSEMTKCKAHEYATEDSTKNFKAVQAWWQKMAKTNNQTITPAANTAMLYSANKCSLGFDQGDEFIHEHKEMKPQMQNSSQVSKEEAMDNVLEAAAARIQLAWWRKTCNSRYKQCLSAIKIQSHVRGWISRRRFVQEKQAIVGMQTALRTLRLWRNLRDYVTKTRSASVIQSHARGWMSRKASSRRRDCIILIQSHCRGWLARKLFFSQKLAAVKIQSAARVLKCSNNFHATICAAVEIQRLVRGSITRSRLHRVYRLKHNLMLNCFFKVCLSKRIVDSGIYLTDIVGAASPYSAAWRECDLLSPRNGTQIIELKIVLCSIIKLQKWWREVLGNKERTKAAVVIESHARRFIVQRRTCRAKDSIVQIQSFWRGYLARKNQKSELHNLRLRVLKSAANVDDDMRIINKHIAALNELVNMRSLSNILRNCATLDRATEVSQRCCEMLVDAGAIDILLKQICSVSRSIPDQEVLKHSLSILRNLARYPHLADVLIDHQESVETIFWELLRNKENGFFIACDLLKKICQRQKGIERVCSLTHLLKRLQGVVDELTKKASRQKRNDRGQATQQDTIGRRLKEADELLSLISRLRANI